MNSIVVGVKVGVPLLMIVACYDPLNSDNGRHYLVMILGRYYAIF